MENIFEPLQGSSKVILFVGIGNRLKRDDAVGIYICENLATSGQKQILIVESGIEKYIGKINKLSPDILVLVDSTDFGEKPGYTKLVRPEQIVDETTNTHTISVKKLSKFFDMSTFILGIQPKNSNFGEELSPIVKERANRIIDYINNKL